MFVIFHSNITLLYPIAGVLHLASGLGYLFLVRLDYRTIGGALEGNGNEQALLLGSDNKEMVGVEEENIKQE